MYWNSAYAHLIHWPSLIPKEVAKFYKENTIYMSYISEQQNEEKSMKLLTLEIGKRVQWLTFLYIESIIQ